jgi:hypothetical protein
MLPGSREMTPDERLYRHVRRIDHVLALSRDRAAIRDMGSRLRV